MGTHLSPEESLSPFGKKGSRGSKKPCKGCHRIPVSRKPLCLESAGTTSGFLALLLMALAALTVVAWLWKPAKPVDGKIPLTWVSDGNPARGAQIDAFNRENPDLRLELDSGNVGIQKIIMQCVSGVGPDIFDYANDQLEIYAEAGILWDVTDAAKEMGFFGKDAGWPAGAQTYTYKGRQYGFPCNIGPLTLIYNKNVFDHFSVPYPQGILTWDEFFSYAQRVSSRSNPKGAKGKDIYAITGLDWRIFFDSAGGQFFDEKGWLRIQDNADLRRAFEMQRDLIFKYRLAPTLIEAKQMSGQGGWGSGSLNQFANGRYAMIVTGHWALIAFERAHDQQARRFGKGSDGFKNLPDPLDHPLRLGATLIPHFAGKNPRYRISSRIAGINSRSPHREEALKFLQYLAGPTYSRMLNEEADFLPGNPRFANLGVNPGPPDLARQELQDITVQAMAFGHVFLQSPFLFLSDVNQALMNQIARMESNPDLDIDELLRAAHKELTALMRRHLNQNPALRDEFLKRFGEKAYQNL